MSVNNYDFTHLDALRSRLKSITDPTPERVVLTYDDEILSWDEGAIRERTPFVGIVYDGTDTSDGYDGGDLYTVRFHVVAVLLFKDTEDSRDRTQRLVEFANAIKAQGHGMTYSSTLAGTTPAHWLSWPSVRANQMYDPPLGVLAIEGRITYWATETGL